MAALQIFRRDARARSTKRMPLALLKRAAYHYAAPVARYFSAREVIICSIRHDVRHYTPTLISPLEKWLRQNMARQRAHAII